MLQYLGITKTFNNISLTSIAVLCSSQCPSNINTWGPHKISSPMCYNKTDVWALCNSLYVIYGNTAASYLSKHILMYKAFIDTEVNQMSVMVRWLLKRAVRTKGLARKFKRGERLSENTSVMSPKHIALWEYCYRKA